MVNTNIQGQCLLKGLQKLQGIYECMGDMRGKRLMVGVEFVKDHKTEERATEWRDETINIAFQKGLLLLECGEHSIRFSPPLTVTPDKVDVCVFILDETIKKVAG